MQYWITWLDNIGTYLFQSFAGGMNKLIIIIIKVSKKNARVLVDVEGGCWRDLERR